MTGVEARKIAERIIERSQCSWGEAEEVARYILGQPTLAPPPIILNLYGYDTPERALLDTIAEKLYRVRDGWLPHEGARAIVGDVVEFLNARD